MKMFKAAALCTMVCAFQVSGVVQLADTVDLSDPGQVMEAIGSMVTGLRAEMRAEMQALKNDTQAVEKGLRREIDWLKKDREAVENRSQARQAIAKTQAVLLEESKKDKLMLWSVVHQLSNKTNTHTTRIDHCETETSPFIQDIIRRRLQDANALCHGSGLTAMFGACCPRPRQGGGGTGSNGGHRRSLQGEGCDLPATCTATCALHFIGFFEGCQDMINALSPGDQRAFVGLFARCNEREQQDALTTMQPVEVRMYRVIIDAEAAQQAAMANSGGSSGGGSPSPPFGPVILPPGTPPPPPTPPAEGGAVTSVEEYHARCTTANILTCVPACNATTHGYELLATIDGTDTKFSCNLANLLFSWVGAAALGGFLGKNVFAFVSAVISGAAGTYVLTLTGDADVSTALTIQPGQHVIIGQDPSLAEAASWGAGGLTLSTGATLQLDGIEISGQVVVAEGAALVLKRVTFAPDGKCLDPDGAPACP